MEPSAGVDMGVSEGTGVSCGTSASDRSSVGTMGVSMPGVISLGSVSSDRDSVPEQAVKLQRIMRAVRMAKIDLNFFFMSGTLLVILGLPFAPPLTISARQLSYRSLFVETVQTAVPDVRIRIRHWNTSI